MAGAATEMIVNANVIAKVAQFIVQKPRLQQRTIYHLFISF